MLPFSLLHPREEKARRCYSGFISQPRERRAPPESHRVHKAIFPLRRVSGPNSLQEAGAGSWNESFGLATGMHLRRGYVSTPRRRYTNTPGWGRPHELCRLAKYSNPPFNNIPGRSRGVGATPRAESAFAEPANEFLGKAS